MAPTEIPTILIVDDDWLIRAVVRALLACEGYRVADAGNGGRALELARSEPPDLVILDSHLADVHGLELARRLRELPGLELVPVILFAGEDFDGDCGSTPFPHVSGYVSRYASGQELLDCVKSYLRL